MLSTTFFTLTVLASCAFAQSSSTTSSSASAPSASGLTPCIMNCVMPAAQAAGCASFTDLSCVCTSTQFQQQAAQCLEQQCTQQEVQDALNLQSIECAGVVESGSGSAPLPASTSISMPSTATSAAQTTSAQTTPTAPVGSSSGMPSSSMSGISSNSSFGASNSTASTASSSGPSGVTNSSASAPAQTTNAAMTNGHGIGVVGLFVASLFGLAL